MNASLELIIKTLSMMIKDQRGYAPEDFESVLEELVTEILNANSA